MIYSVQYMRAIAALLVVVHHAAGKGAQYSSAPFEWFTIGESGVDLFFIISGYIMCHTVDSKDINFFSFIKARIKRIIPLYWVLTTMALVIYLLYPEKVNSSGGGTDIIHSYTLFPIKENYLISNGWTLSYEFFFYLLFAFSLSFTSKYKFLIPIVLIVTLVNLGNLSNFNLSNTTVFDFVTNPLLLEFSFGILVYYLFKKNILNSVLGLSLIIISASLFSLVNVYQPDYSRIINYGVPALIFFIGMIALESFFKSTRENKVALLFKMIGNSSYSLYLSHPFALVTTSIILDKLGLNEFGYLFVLLLVISSVIAGQLCYLLLEKNLVKIVRYHKKKNLSLNLEQKTS